MKSLLLLLLLPSVALALPSQIAGTLANTASPTAFSVSDDERLAALATTSGALLVWDRGAWSDGANSVDLDCNPTALQFVDYAGSDARLWVGCDDGTVVPVDFETSMIPATATVGDPLTLTVLGDQAEVIDLAWAPSDTVVHVVYQVGTQMTVTRFPLAGDSVDATLQQTVVATAVDLAIGEDGGPVVVSRNDGRLTVLTRSGEAYSPSELPLLPLASAGSVAVSSESALILVADRSDGAVWQLPTVGGFLEEEFGSFGTPGELAWGDSDTGPVVWVAESGGTLHPTDDAGVELDSIDLGGVDAATIVPLGGEDGVVYVAGTDGAVRVVADFPFVDSISATPAAVGEGEAFAVAFTVSVDSDWDLRRDGSFSSTSGTSLATGRAVAGDEVTVDLDATDLTAEGDNRLMLFVDDGGPTGLDSVVVTLDAPPGGVSGVEAGAADGRLDLEWTAGDETDVASFEVFVSDLPFTEASLPTSFEGRLSDGTAVTYPTSVDFEGAGVRHEARLTGLANGTEYFVAVRPIDSSDQIGPLSDVVSGTPALTCSAAECAGEPSGCSCSAADARDALPGLLLLAPLWLRRRR